jgi:5-methyltetrahydrofolate--homocysteine methyltransferase
MAMSHGMTSAIVSPLHQEVRDAVMAANVLTGTDENCASWIRANRDPDAAQGARGRRSGRRRPQS